MIRSMRREHGDKPKLKLMEIFNRTFYNVAVWRDIFPCENLNDAGYKFYKYYDEIELDYIEPLVKGITKENLPLTTYREIKLPVISDTLSVYKNGRLNIQGIQESANKLATEEGKLILTGEHPGWPALGINGLLTTDGRKIYDAASSWPSGIVKDLVQARRRIPKAKAIALIVSSEVYDLMNQVMWRDPTHIRPPTTYKHFILTQGIVQTICEVDKLYNQDGEQDSAVLYSMSSKNAWLVQGMKPSPHLWRGLDEKVFCSIREVINIAIANPSAIVEIKRIKPDEEENEQPSINP